MPEYVYPTNVELEQIDQQLVSSLTLDDPIFKMFPIRTTEYTEVQWEQRDNYKGLQQFRGFNGSPKGVPAVGASRFKKDPGVYGEFDAIFEMELTQRSGFGFSAKPINIGDLVAEKQEKLMHRQINRMKWILWTLATTGVYQVTNEFGVVVDRDAYTPQKFASGVLWSVQATSTPLADLRAIQLLGRGQSATFGPEAKQLMNQKTLNYALANTNPNDLGGQKLPGITSIQSLGEFNALLQKEGLPTVEVTEDGYYDEAGNWNMWIADGQILIKGARKNGANIGEFLLTRNGSNPSGSSQPYLRVVEMGMKPNEAPPAQIQVHRGFNGGPAIYYPGAMINATVA